MLNMQQHEDLTNSGYLYGLNESTYYDVPSYEDLLLKSKFTIYHVDVRDNLTISRIDKFNSCIQLLMTLGVSSMDIVRANVDSYCDMDLIDYITEKCGGNFRPPVVFMRNKFLGEYDTLYQLHNEGKLKLLIDNCVTEPTTTQGGGQASTPTTYSSLSQSYLPSPEELSTLPSLSPSITMAINTTTPPLSGSPRTAVVPQMGHISAALEVVETIADYFNPFSYFRSYNSQTPFEIYQELEVIHTNWYGRDQRRKLRFYSEYFQRIHPLGDVIRATHKYNEIQMIQQLDSSHIKILYKNGSPDWICAPPTVISSILSLSLPKIEGNTNNTQLTTTTSTTKNV